MVRFLLLLIFLLLSLTKVNNVQANTACYCTYYPGDNRCHLNTTCWACAPGAQDSSWQSLFCLSGYQAACQVQTETQTLSCQANYSGSITQSRTKTCPDNQWQAWTTTQNSCVANPPTCQTSSQQQTLACPTGYTGSIIQTRLLTCPNPYSPAVINSWMTTTNTCVKSVSNPTNPSSPVNPANPMNRSSTTSAPTIQSSPATAPTPNIAPNSEAIPMAPPPPPPPPRQKEQEQKKDEPEAKPKEREQKKDEPEAKMESKMEAKTDSQTTSNTQASPSPPPKGKTQSVVGLVLSLELFVKPGLQQGNVFSEQQMVGGIPNNMLIQDSIMMDILQQREFKQPDYNQDLGFEQ